MNTFKFKKIGLGLSFVFLGLAILTFVPLHKVTAAGGPINGTSEWQQAHYAIGTNTTVVVTLAGGDHDPINFTDSTPNDATHVYTADTNGTGVCSGTITFAAGQTFTTKPSITATITVKFANSQGPTPSCTDGGNATFNNGGKPITITNNLTAGGGQQDTGPASITYNGQTYTQIGSTRAYGLSGSIGTNCYGGQILVLNQLDTQAAAPVNGTVLDTILSATATGTELSTQVANFPAIPLTIATLGKCMYNENTDQGNNAQVSVTAAGVATFTGCSNGGTTCGGAPTGNTGPTCDPTTNPDCAPVPNSCESGYTGAAHEFNWIFCKILAGMDGMFNSFNNLLEDQLNLCTGTSSTTQATCGNNILTDQVKQAWSVFRILATSLLVVLMLVMVLSQAIGGGPFDAYTIRKMLPKLVIAAIVIQISWYVFKWVIDVSNDVGMGIANLMYWPFGGASKLAFDNVVANVGVAAPSATIGLFSGMILVGFIASGLTVFGVGFLAVSVIASLVIGLLVLLFRQILIILLMIFVPLAILAWILPGTQRYWKMWWDNFIKLLFMFPLIIAMIAAGRIFASIGSTSGESILSLVIVFLGFFGPYWFLPKTFRWGGQAFGALASGTMSATKGLRNYPAKYAMEGAKSNREFRAGERARRIGRDPQSASRFDRLLAGGYNRTRSAANIDRHYAQTIATGQKEAREAVGQELAVAGYQNWSHEKKLDANEAWLRGEKFEDIDAENNEELRLFAFKTLADLGDQDRIRRARQDGKLRGSVWLKGRAENISALNQQASDMGIQNDLSTVAADSMANWKGHTFNEWLRQVDQGEIMDNSDAGGGAIKLDARDPTGQQRADQLARARSQATRVLNNRLLFDRLSADQQAAVQRMATQGGTQVVVSDGQGVQLPSGETMATNQTARESVISTISQSSKPGSDGERVASTLAEHIVNANLNPGSVSPADQHGHELVFAQVRDRAAAADATPEMQTAFANLQNGINAALQRNETEVEQRHVAAGSPDTATILAAEKARSAAVKARLGIP